MHTITRVDPIRQSNSPRPLEGFRVVIAGLVVVGFAMGCADSELDFVEYKNIDEKVTDSEFERFLRVVEVLPEKKLPPIPQVLGVTTSWDSRSTLPVSELMNEEQKKLDARWSVEEVARSLEKNRKLAWALRREQMTLKQFAGLSIALGSAMSKWTLTDQQDLTGVISKAREKLQILRKTYGTATFFRLKPDEQFTVVRDADYLGRADCARRLQSVPPENVAIVRKNIEKLRKIFPRYFAENPFDAVADLLEERGMPFEELAASGFDVEITWDPEKAEVGTDAPDTVKASDPMPAAPSKQPTHQP